MHVLAHTTANVQFQLTTPTPNIQWEYLLATIKIMEYKLPQFQLIFLIGVQNYSMKLHYQVEYSTYSLLFKLLAISTPQFISQKNSVNLVARISVNPRKYLQYCKHCTTETCKQTLTTCNKNLVVSVNAKPYKCKIE